MTILWPLIRPPSVLFAASFFFSSLTASFHKSTMEIVKGLCVVEKIHDSPLSE